jgi:valyl-tRNA synthetase
MSDELPPQYQPGIIEAPLYGFWEERGCFQPRILPGARPRSRPGRPFVIMMPPPNVTAVLHMGHGLNNTVQDVLVRFERMRGRPTLWLPGTDHAGIATQNVVEKLLLKEGTSRQAIGREAFVARVWAFVRETGSAILEQLRAIGASADWSRTYFTLDPDLSRAVREVFVRLYQKGLIYRGKYIINWCPRCLTALSNEEAERSDVEGHLWRIRYPLADGDGHVVVATTRPETMLGDTAVAVHPNDERYRALVGRRVRLPLTDREIPLVADQGVDPAFGTGAVKVTPAHDPLDFEIAQRQGLPAIDIMTDDARMSDAVPERFRGLDRFEARRRVVEELEAAGLLERVESHRHAVAHCYRCDTVVEPRLSDQWFVRMAPLARPALEAYRAGRLRFLPEHRGEEYASWMENIRDWCISRQLWWGHRIPVWYCDACGTGQASRKDLTTCPGCAGPLRQDPDVLDTWFSSWLVPFSSLGWPDDTADLRTFYPGSVLVTAPEIIFFWVARMVMAGCEFMGDIPFHTVYLHGTVRDTQHRKMSKSLGNGIDPLEVVQRFGADALRYTVIAGMAVGTDVILDPDDLETSFAPGRNFANKLWNVGRFILTNLDGPTVGRSDGPPVRPLAGPYRDVIRRDELALADRWILDRCDHMVREATASYQKFRLNEAALAAYHFIWSDLADWYLEQVKPRLYGTSPGGDVARAVVARVFEVALQVLHPVMPFITEALWKRYPGRAAEATISLTAWPVPDHRAVDADADREFGMVQELVGAVRQIRAEYGVSPGATVRAVIAGAGTVTTAAIAAERATIQRLAKLSELTPDGTTTPAGGAAGANAVLSDGTSVFVPLGEVLDLARECQRLAAEWERLERAIGGQRNKLANSEFVSRAPADVVKRERDKLAQWEEQSRTLAAKRRHLGCG